MLIRTESNQVLPREIYTGMDELYKLLLSTDRERAHENMRSTIELDTIRSEMHMELVDREANAARVAERQRFLFERSSAQAGQASAAERASASASYVEAALAALCPHTTPASPGCAQLAASSDEF
mgnify:FL=1